MLGVDAHRFAEIAAIALTPRPAPTVATEHLHELMVSVPEQAEHLLAMLKARGSGQWASFSELVADCTAPIEIVGRFLALLELYRTRAVAFEQSEPLGALRFRGPVTMQSAAMRRSGACDRTYARTRSELWHPGYR